MLITIATYTEAAPIIEALELKLVEKRPFLLYQNGSLSLIVTGIGSLHAATAVGYIVSQPLLNIGICAGQEIGKLYNIYKVIDGCTDKSYLLTKDPILPNAALRTQPKPQESAIRHLVDMEAAGILLAATRFSIRPKIYKIVSDRYDPASITKAHVLQLIEQNLQQLLDIIANLKKDLS